MRIDGETLFAEIAELATLSEQEPPAVTRVVFSECDMRAREFFRLRCEAAGLSVRWDAVGNGFARWEGAEPGLPAVATGSHCDAIPNAGAYDGVVGVLGGLEAIRALQRSGFQPRRAIELIFFTSEEPTRFGIGCLGSRLLAGTLDPARADELADRDGCTLADWRERRAYRGDLANVRLAPGHYAAFVELHIEQGPLLERAGLDLGVVERIAAPASFRLALAGEGGHAGAVLMPDRRDALLAAAEIALAVERAALQSGSPDTVATTGVLRIEPGAVNSVPARAWLELDLRDTRLASRDRAQAAIEAAVAEICARRRIEARWEVVNADPPAESGAPVLEAAEAAARQLAVSHQRMVSRAYHDSLFMARVCPMGMLFIPCRQGWSHRPDEYAAPEAISAGAGVLALTLQRLAG